MPTKRNYHKPPEDPIGGGLKEKGREGVVMSPSMGTFGEFQSDCPTRRLAILLIRAGGRQNHSGDVFSESEVRA